ncbi:calcium-binding protein [Mameliella alba]|uniref:calcium-binding protein n=2 Tax=Mameliella alba TaxID=561184 RepID=UPI0035E67ADC
MASFNINTLVTTQQVLGVNEAGIIGPDGSLQVFNTPIIANAANALLVQGSILGFNVGVNATAATALEVVVGQNGSILSNGRAIQADVTDNTRIVNHGSINGTITALELTADGGSAIAVNHDVVNTGVLSSTRGPTVLLEMANTGFIEFSNSGQIVSASDAIDNSMSASGLAVFRNTGEILAGQDLDAFGNVDFAFLGGVVVEYFINQGFVSGEINMGGGADFFNGNGGTVSGKVKGGTGNDTLLGGENADVLEGGEDADLLIGRGGDDVLAGDAGNDMMLGGAGNDEMSGGNSNDTMTGNAGDDTMEGGAGADLLVGQDGSDVLDGGILDDILDGGNGDDVLEGGSGDDILRGRAGEDDLAGGLGSDLLTGGQGADSFVFRTLSETAVGALRDQVLDFEQGVDLIIVAGLSPGIFEFRGTAGFAPSGNPELRLFETPTGSTIVQLDANGDGTADAEIRVANVTGLTADDFVL